MINGEGSVSRLVLFVHLESSPAILHAVPLEARYLNILNLTSYFKSIIKSTCSSLQVDPLLSYVARYMGFVIAAFFRIRIVFGWLLGVEIIFWMIEIACYLTVRWMGMPNFFEGEQSKYQMYCYCLNMTYHGSLPVY